MNNYIDIFKTIWKNKRYRALIILSLYIIFFAVVILIAKMSPKVNTSSSLDNFENKQIFDFQITVDDQTIVGNFNNNRIAFIYQGITYNYINQKLDNENFEYKEILDYVSHQKIKDIISSKETTMYSETRYNDGTYGKTYKNNNLELTTYQKEEIYQVDIKLNNKEYNILYK